MPPDLASASQLVCVFGFAGAQGMARCNAQQSDDHPWQDEQMNVMTAKDLSAAATQLGGEERAARKR